MGNEDLETVESKKVFSRIGFSLFIMVLAVIFAQSVIATLIYQLSPALEDSPWYVGLLVGIPVYLVGVPVFLAMVRKLPNGSKGDAEKMSIKDVFVAFLISMAGTYIFNIVGIIINSIISTIKGSDVVNPLESLLGGASIIPTIIFVGILSPIAEEFIFRGVLLDKLRGYGERRAIFFTALTFALFHGNLSQFFYAFILGVIFGFIAFRTNTIKYTIILHILINIFGSVIMPGLALSGDPILTMIAGFGVIVFGILGIILFIVNIKRIKLEPKESENHINVRKNISYGNIGMILYYIVCSWLFISTIMLS